MKRSEKEYHDEYYCGLDIHDQDLIVQIEGFLESLDQNPIGDLYRCLLERLGDPKGKHLLDYGCGTGQVGVFFARSGAYVRGFDVSEKGAEIANRRARINGVTSQAVFETMDSRSLAYENDTFDGIVGRWILHHLDKQALPACGREIRRVLKEGGKALFIEPLGDNPLIEYIRAHPFYSKGGYASEHETTMKRLDILGLGEGFRTVLIHEFHLLYMLKRVVRRRKVLGALKAIDASLLKVFPLLKRYCGECVIEYVK